MAHACRCPRGLFAHVFGQRETDPEQISVSGGSTLGFKPTRACFKFNRNWVERASLGLVGVASVAETSLVCSSFDPFATTCF